MAKSNEVFPEKVRLNEDKEFLATSHKENNICRVVFFARGDKRNSFAVNNNINHLSIFKRLFKKKKKSILAFAKFHDNQVTSARYTAWNFLPLQLFHQLFTKMANLYFLFISILQQPKGWSPTGKYTTLGPLTLFVTLAMLREAYDDYKRHKQDSTENNKKVETAYLRVIGGTQDHTIDADDLKATVFAQTPTVKEYAWKTKQWKNLTVGDIVRLKSGDSIPADIVILKTSYEDGSCFVQTRSLDGESNLKQKQAVEDTQTMSIDELINVQGFVSKGYLTPGCINTEYPNNELYKFDGSLEYHKTSEQFCKKLPLSINSLLLRGSTLKNTEEVIGVVAFSGEDTKIRRNAMTTLITKSPHIERTTNQIVFFLFLFITTLAVVSTVFSLKWRDESAPHDYVGGDTPVHQTFFTFVILYNSMIPISLYVMMEMIKLIQAYFISADVEMYDENADIPAEARTSSLNEDLGQVSYIFSDKTGTLTDNIMSFKKFSVAGSTYQMIPLGSGGTISPRHSSGTMSKKDAASRHVITTAFGNDSPEKEKICTFFRSMAVCHTVIPARPAEMGSDFSKIEYQASSPDEEAILNAARDFGYIYSNKRGHKVEVTVKNPLMDEVVATEEYDLLKVIEFTSARKRMSAIYRYPDGRIVFFCKGADSEIQKRLSKQMAEEDQTIYNCAQEHLKRYASEGLRVLMFATKVLSESDYEVWSQKYDNACGSVVNRDEMVDKIADEMENDLTFAGVTAIEDKLQDGVPETLETLRLAGIKLWVLTGDKKETAINIGHSCNLIKSDSNIHIIDWAKMNGAEGIKEFLLNLRNNLKNLRAKESKSKSRNDVSVESRGEHHVIVIDGDTLSSIKETAILPLGHHNASSKSEKNISILKLLIEVGTFSDTVICCRVSPSQKALIVQEVKIFTKYRKVTLAIGDGANDVAMIKEAHVGIGIAGREGMQASRSSDYSIPRFRFLKRLLLVHGHWSYVRLSKFIMGSFYKCVAFFLTQTLFQRWTGISGTSLYESWTLALYNILFSSGSVFAIGVFEKDLNEEVLLAVPDLYREGPKNENYNWKRFMTWLISAFYQAACFLLIPIAFFGIVADSSAEDAESSIYVLGTIVYTGAMIVVNLKIAWIESYSWCWVTQFVTFIPIAFWFVHQFLYSRIWNGGSIGYEIYGMFDHLFAKAAFLLTALLVVTVALIPEITAKVLKRWLFPSEIMVYQERYKSSPDHFKKREAQLEEIVTKSSNNIN